MSKKKIIATVLFVLVLLGWVISLVHKTTSRPTTGEIQPQAGNLGNFINSPHISTSINNSWDYMSKGNAMMRGQNYPQAIQMYTEAYKLQDYVGPLPGFKLIEAYERNSQYVDALKILEGLNRHYDFQNNEEGLRKYNEIRSRLLAAKQTAN